jgi:excisionase family DNA binding protein
MQPPDLSDDLLRGADAIARYMGLSRRAIYHLVATSRLPVCRVGSTICARRSILTVWIEAQERQAVSEVPR